MIFSSIGENIFEGSWMSVTRTPEHLFRRINIFGSRMCVNVWVLHARLHIQCSYFFIFHQENAKMLCACNNTIPLICSSERLEICLKFEKKNACTRYEINMKSERKKKKSKAMFRRSMYGRGRVWFILLNRSYKHNLSLLRQILLLCYCRAFVLDKRFLTSVSNLFLRGQAAIS